MNKKIYDAVATIKAELLNNYDIVSDVSIAVYDCENKDHLDEPKAAKILEEVSGIAEHICQDNCGWWSNRKDFSRIFNLTVFYKGVDEDGSTTDAEVPFVPLSD